MNERAVCPSPEWVDWVLKVGTYKAGLSEPLQFVAMLAGELRAERAKSAAVRAQGIAQGRAEQRAEDAAACSGLPTPAPQ